jgi:hypothetical protein
MNTTFTVVRAIGAEFARRLLGPLTLTGAIAAVLLLAIGGWLTTINVWWWFLEAAFIIFTVVFVVLWVVSRLLLRLADPPQSGDQRQLVRSFVDKLERVSENLKTPQPVIIYRVIRDTIRPRKDNFIETVSRDSKSLAPDFLGLIKRFTTDREKARP